MSTVCFYRKIYLWQVDINIGIVDDKTINRNTVKHKLALYSQINIVLEANNGKDFLEQLKNIPDKKKPKLILMDLDMPIMDGIEAIKVSAAAYPEIKIIVLTIFEDTDRIFEAIKAGASGYLLKDDKAVNIMDAITNVIEHNGVPMSPTIARKAMEMLINKPITKKTEENTLGLSERELEILKNLSSGSTYSQIGEKLFISPLTVRKHVANLYAKLHVNNRVQVINIAQKNNLI